MITSRCCFRLPEIDLEDLIDSMDYDTTLLVKNMLQYAPFFEIYFLWRIRMLWRAVGLPLPLVAVHRSQTRPRR